MKEKILFGFRSYAQDWWQFVRVPYNFLNIIVSLLFLEVAYETTKVAAMLATKNAGDPIGDIIISNLPRIDTSFIHGTLSFFMYDLRTILFVVFIRYTPFAAKALASIIFLRAIAINLTNLGMPEGITPISSTMTFGGDLFFSGHVANTFMLCLIFWHIQSLRYIFMVASIIFGVSAVLGHYHYTIDVLAAPFFAYGIFTLCKKIFKNDYLLTVNSNNTKNVGVV